MWKRCNPARVIKFGASINDNMKTYAWWADKVEMHRCNWHCGWWVIVKLRLLRFCWVGSSVTWTNQHVELVYVVQYVSVVLVVDDEGKRSREGLCRCTMCSEGRTRTLGPRDRGRDDHGWSTSSTRTTRGFAEGVKMALTQVKVGSRQVKWGPRMNWRSLAEDEVDMHRHWVIWQFQP